MLSTQEFHERLDINWHPKRKPIWMVEENRQYSDMYNYSNFEREYWATRPTIDPRHVRIATFISYDNSESWCFRICNKIKRLVSNICRRETIIK